MITRLSCVLLLVSFLIVSGCKISGTIKNEDGSYVQGATVFLSGNLSMVATTDNSGYYEFDNIFIFKNTYTITPSVCVFDVKSKNVMVDRSHVSGIDFLALSCPDDIYVKEISFNYDADNNKNDAINIRENRDTEIDVPEYQRDIQNKPAAYIRNSHVSIRVKFGILKNTNFQCRIQGISDDTDGLLGDTEEVLVDFSGGESGYVDFTIPSATPDKICKSIDTWNWTVSDDDSTRVVDQTSHLLYCLLDTPKEPWTQNQDIISTQKNHNPWTTILDMACEWTQGISRKDGAIKEITQKTYDIMEAYYAYQNHTGPLGITFDLTLFMHDMGNDFIGQKREVVHKYLNLTKDQINENIDPNDSDEMMTKLEFVEKWGFIPDHAQGVSTDCLDISAVVYLFSKIIGIDDVKIKRIIKIDNFLPALDRWNVFYYNSILTLGHDDENGWSLDPVEWGDPISTCQERSGYNAETGDYNFCINYCNNSRNCVENCNDIWNDICSDKSEGEIPVPKRVWKQGQQKREEYAYFRSHSVVWHNGGIYDASLKFKHSRREDGSIKQEGFTVEDGWREDGLALGCDEMDYQNHLHAIDTDGNYIGTGFQWQEGMDILFN